MFARTRLLINTFRIFWVGIVIWYEIGTFFRSTARCHWPEPEPNVQPKHVLIIADPQILNLDSYPDRSPLLNVVTQFIVDLYLRKSWWAALRTNPDVVIFLGDMMDNGRSSMPDEEYEAYFKRFQNIFKMDSSIPRYYLAGNHDVGLGHSDSFSIHARDRYISHFGELNTVVSVGNHTLVLVDAPALVEEDFQRASRKQSYAQWTPNPSGPVEFIKSTLHDQSNAVVLFTHIPLARDDHSSCGPFREKGAINSGAGFGYQNTLSKDATDFLLSSIQPSVVYSGDDHDFCELVHSVIFANGQSKSIREVTVKSFSMVMGIRQPGFQMLTLIPPFASGKGYADTLCLLPDQLRIYLAVYIPLVLLSIFLLAADNIRRIYTSRRGSRRHVPLIRIEDEDMAEVSSASLPRNNVRPRSEVGDEWLTPLSVNELVDFSSTSLPPPAGSFRSRKRDEFRLTWTFALNGRRRRIAISAASCFSVVSALFWSRSSRRHRNRGVIVGVLCDVRDVIYFPLITFVLISWCMFTDK